MLGGSIIIMLSLLKYLQPVYIDPVCARGAFAYHNPDGSLWVQPFCDPGLDFPKAYWEYVHDLDEFDYPVDVPKATIVPVSSQVFDV